MVGRYLNFSLRAGMCGGLNFVAFGRPFDAFEAQLKRMLGAEDGVTDALSSLRSRFPGAISGVRRCADKSWT